MRDNPERDIKGAKRAGYGVTIILKTAQFEEHYKGDAKPDLFIEEFGELMKIFPER